MKNWPAYTQIADELKNIGWKDSCDAQHEELKKWWEGLQLILHKNCSRSYDEGFEDAKQYYSNRSWNE